MNVNDLAKAAGVSVATVSRVLNNSSNVSPETRSKVLKVINEMGYRIKKSKNDGEKKTRLILVLITSMGNSLYSDMVKGMEEVANKMGFHVIVANCYNNEEHLSAFLPLLSRKIIDGIIMAGTLFNTGEILKLSLKFPIVQCGEILCDDLPFVSTDNESAAFEIVNMIAAKGRKRIALLTVNNLRTSTVGRLKGYIRALQHNNIPFDKDLVVYSTYGYHDTLEVMEKFIYENPDIDGLFSISDKMAAAAIHVFKKAGKRVPEDISVASIDNSQYSYTIEPNITTVYHRQTEMGRKAAEMLINKINNKAVPSNQIFVGYDLIKRDSI